MTDFSRLPILEEPLEACAPPTTGLARAILPEIATSLGELASSRTESQIDLRSLPMTDADRDELAELLGRGEVSMIVSVAGESEVWETQYAGVWWVRHKSADGSILVDFIEIASIPKIAVCHPDDIKHSHTQLMRLAFKEDQRSAAR